MKSENGFNQNKAARALGFKKSFFSRLISGQRNLRYPAAKKLSAKLNCKPELFLLGGGTPAERRRVIEIAVQNATKK